MMRNQGTASKRNTAAESATYFVKVVRALLRSPPRGATVASAVEEDCDEAATDRIRKNREPRTALDVSGHRFAKNLQVEVGRTRNRRQQPVASEPADSDGKYLPEPATQRQQQQQQQLIFSDVPEEHRGLFSPSGAWLKEGAAADGRKEHADGDKPSPRSSPTSTLPPSPAAAVTTAAARPRSELPPLVPKTRSRSTTGTCRRRQACRAAYFA